MSFFKNGEQEGKRSYLGVVTSERGEDVKKVCRRLNAVELLRIYV
jgi:hypothetical protein